MAAVKGSTDIARAPEDVFAYSADPARRQEWQPSVREIETLTPGPVTGGTRVRERREVTGGARTFVWEFTGYDPPNRWSFRVVDGSVRPEGTMTLSPRDGGAGTHVDFEMDFVGSGIGKLFAPLARRGAPKQVGENLSGLKRALEAGGAG
jgi:uncharacterized protein YndB with AHSA1/START domain